MTMEIQNNPTIINFNVLLIHFDYCWPSIVITESAAIKWITIIFSNSLLLIILDSILNIFCQPYTEK